MTIKDLQPAIVWKYFDEITQIPRPSKKEEKIIAYLENFAKERNLEFKKDKAGNVVITKPATPGYEALPTVILQSHVDMVCEKNNDTDHDFDNDPIRTRIENGWVKAEGTTLGADNGIGVAAELAVLASDDLEHGKIECLFTVDEETGLSGAFALESGFLTGDILLNLDTEDEGEIYIGCAGGKDTQAFFTYQPAMSPEGYFYFRVDVKGLNGGHSGSEIDKGLGNANKILTRYLYELKKKFDIVLCEIDGGNLRNAIAREARAVVGVPASEKETARIMLNQLAADVEGELKAVDPNVRLTMESVERPAHCIDRKTSYNLINSLYACPHGVIAMSHAIPGLVETSTNLASVKMKADNTIVVGTSQRSSTESSKDDVANMVAATFQLAGAETKHGDGYPGWKPNTDSLILKVAQESYKDLYHKDAQIKAIHAGLECGLFLQKYPHLDMVSIGPTMRDVHSPNERLEIESVKLWWDFMVELLKNIPAKQE
ncbi:MAG: aminoacyl-histidine dipeptidase [Tannerellaceae bacterium]